MDRDGPGLPGNLCVCGPGHAPDQLALQPEGHRLGRLRCVDQHVRPPPPPPSNRYPVALPRPRSGAPCIASSVTSADSVRSAVWRENRKQVSQAAGYMCIGGVGGTLATLIGKAVIDDK